MKMFCSTASESAMIGNDRRLCCLNEGLVTSEWTARGNKQKQMLSSSCQIQTIVMNQLFYVLPAQLKSQKVPMWDLSELD